MAGYAVHLGLDLSPESSELAGTMSMCMQSTLGCGMHANISHITWCMYCNIHDCLAHCTIYGLRHATTPQKLGVSVPLALI